jgi:hypothetical protein
MSNISAVGTSNLAGVLLRSVQLGLSASGAFTFTADQVKNLTAVQTPYPCKVILRVKLTSGTLTVAGDVNATGTYAAQDGTTGAISDTNDHFLVLNTTSSLTKVAYRLTSGGAGNEAVIDELEVMVLALLDPKDNGIEVTRSFNACSGEDGVTAWTSGEGDG